MTEHLRTLAWLALLVLGSALVVAQLDGEHGPAPVQHAGHHHGDEHEPRKIFTWEPEQITAIEITTGANVLRYQREDNRWRAPDGSPADSTMIDDYLSLFSQARMDREFMPERGDKHAYSLQPPVLHIRLTNAADAALADVRVGARTPDGFGRYAMIPGDDHVLIIPGYQFAPALKLAGKE